MVRACHTPRQPFQNHTSGHLGGLAMPWSADEMLNGQHQRVGISAHSRTAHNGLLQKRLAESFLMSLRRPNRSRGWTEVDCLVYSEFSKVVSWWRLARLDVQSTVQCHSWPAFYCVFFIYFLQGWREQVPLVPNTKEAAMCDNGARTLNGALWLKSVDRQSRDSLTTSDIKSNGLFKAKLLNWYLYCFLFLICCTF